MTEVNRYQEAVAAGMLPSEESHQALLQSIVDVARAIFGAEASSIFLLDETTDELVFEAVSGHGEGDLVGMRMPSSTGIAGWVLVTGQPLVIDDLQHDPRFARQAAEQTGYVPQALMAVPLVNGEMTLGVLQVLDRARDRVGSIGEIDLLILFANQAAIGLDLLQTARRARSVADSGSGLEAIVARIATLLEQSGDEESGLRLLEALEAVLARLAR
ncbi:GAF domain-containing protein [Gaiella sp.]|uniref:GAF domain-containing protein n=1 Tax=Gaiella sp. TaxID=2663207 RepID=UPI003264C9A7